MYSERAGLAELADALDLGSSVRKGVGVQVSRPAPTQIIHFARMKSGAYYYGE